MIKTVKEVIPESKRDILITSEGKVYTECASRNNGTKNKPNIVYLVYRGEVYSNGKPKYSIYNKDIDIDCIEWGGKVFKPHECNVDRGYKRVTITYPDGKRKWFGLHVLVNALFNNGDMSMHTHHIDGNKSNNRADNLVSLDNDEHARLHEAQGDYKFNKAKITNIKVFYKGVEHNYHTVKEWALSNNLNIDCCYRVLNGTRKTYKGWHL